MIKRAFDILFSIIGIVILSPAFFFVAVFIKIDSNGPVFYKQSRVGKNNKDFILYKFRTMNVGSDKEGLLTVGNNDSRITKTGYLLRKYKLDELPQLMNVLKGDMSFVGPRPEVRKYVSLYNEEQKKVLTSRPGITDVASIEYRNENELLEKTSNPEEFYVKEVMPDKLKMNIMYINDRSFFKDIKIILKTIKSILS